MIGKELNHFRVLDRLGKGGMGEVYVAEDGNLKRRVALKVLPEEMAGDPVRLERFQREAETIAALNHPNIVTIYSIEEAEGVRFLTMELVEGNTLDQQIPSGGMDIEPFLRFSSPVAEALSAAHEKGIIHRDLKPANIMINNEGRIKILDFGLAKLLRDDSDPNASQLETRAKTAEGIVMGTMPYMSPEQVQGKKLDHRTDIFSLGIIFYEMITGQRPFQGDTSADLISSILRDSPLPVGELKGQVPEHLERIIRRCLAKDPRDRYQTARDVYNELRDLRAGTGPASQPSSAVSKIAETELWIAVLPFRSPGNDPDTEMLADGLTEDITMGLSRFSYLKVIARHSTSLYKDKAIDVRKVGKELNARYILEGAIRKYGSALRISTQLLDTITGAHLWSETYSRKLSEAQIFELQDEISEIIAATVADTSGALIRSMAAQIRIKPAEELSPYEAVLRGLAYPQLLTSQEHFEVRRCLEAAVQRAPDYSDAWATLARLYTEEYKQGFNLLPDSLDRALTAARRAIQLDAASHLGYGALAEVSFFRKDFGTFRTASQKTIDLNNLDGMIVAFMGLLISYSGEWERGLEITNRSISRNPHHPGWYHFSAFFNHYRLGEYEEALRVAERINMPSYYYSHMLLAAVNGQLGRIQAAQNAAGELVALAPDSAMKVREELGEKWLSREPELVERMIDGLRKAGIEVPEGDGSSAPAAPASNRQIEAGADSDAVRAQPHAMWIAVLPFQHPKNPEMESFAEGLSEDITAGLSQFSYLSVIAHHSTLRFKGQSGSISAVRDELGARYVIQGGIRKSASLIRVNVQLIDGQRGTNLWAETYNRNLQEADIFALQDNITDRVVATVADGYGVLVRSMAAALEDKPEAELNAAEWVIQLYRYRQKMSPDEHARLKESLEHAVERNPKQADVWACLCQIYVDEYAGFGYNTQSDSLERALAAGRRALDIDRTSQLGCQLIAQTHFFLRDIAAFRSAAEWSISLNSRDSNTLAILGLMIVHTRDFERGVELVRRAMEINPNHAGWYHFGFIWYHFQKQEYEKALEYANKVNMPGMFWTYLTTGAINGLLGRQAEASAAIRDLLRLDPDFAAKARPNIEAWHYASGLMDTLLDGLKKAGLYIPQADSESSTSRLGDTPDRQVIRSTDTDHRTDSTENSIAILPLREGETSGMPRHATMASSAMQQHHHNLPVAVSSFVGREQEMESLNTLLATQRMITITGAGGSGKSRLALEAALRNTNNFTDGVWQVDLAPVTSDLVVQSIAVALAIKEESDHELLELLTQHLKERKLLLVMDHCEHVLEEAAGIIDSILQSAPDVRILATSREVFHLSSEFVWTVPPLSLVTSRGEMTVEAAARSDAVRLFADRAIARDSRFTLTDTNVEAVAGICARLDGIPLAIELAAARIKVMSAGEILKRLEDCFRLLTAGLRSGSQRHQTMRAAVDWSYELLTSVEQLLFCRLAAFRGGFDLEAAEHVCGFEPMDADQVVDLLLRLIDKSLIVSERTGADQVRYRVLEPLRQYANEKLEAIEQHTTVARRHLDYYAALAERAYKERMESEAEWLDRLEQNHDNFRAALAWASEHEAAGALQLAGSLAWFWVFRSHFTEGRRWLRHVLSGPRLRTRETARALCGAAHLATFQGGQEEQERAQEGLAIWRELGEKRELALALDSIGWHYFYSGNNPGARDAFEEAVRIFQELGDHRLVNHARLGTCQILVSEFDVQQAEPIAEECLPVALHYDDPRDIHFAHHFLADCALIRGDVARAREKYTDSLRAALRIGDRVEILVEVEGIAMALAGMGYDAAALRLKEAIQAECESLRLNLNVPFWEQLKDRYYSPAEKRMGADAAAAEKRIGRSMGFEAAIEYALQQDE